MRLLGAMRLGIVLVLVWMAHASWSASLIPPEQRATVQSLMTAYGVGTLALLGALRVWPARFYLNWALGAVLDLVVLALIILATGGVRAGLAPLVPVMVAGSSVLVRPRWALSLAAAATLALLAVTGWRALSFDDIDTGNFVLAGLLGLACFLVAITISLLATRLKAQEALAEARGQDVLTQLSVTRRVILELEQGVVLMNVEGRISLLNPAAQRILGSLPAGAAEPVNRAAWQALRQACGQLQSLPPDQTMEVSLPMPEGVARLFRLRVLPIASAAAQVAPEPPGDGIAAARSPADILVLIEDVQSLQERAQQLKLAAMGRLSASIAHEIRNPLGAIRHANSLLTEQLQQAAAAGPSARLARIIEDNTVRINTIVEDVLAIARRDRAQIEAIEPVRVLPVLLEEHLHLKGMAADRVKLVIASDAPLWFDSGHLRQVLANLLDNALRFAPASPGAVKLEWSASASGRLQLSIADAGPGIEASHIEHVFEPFYTTHTQGTGLGLFLVREWCVANQAQIHYRRLPAPSPYSGAFIIEPEPR